MNNDGKFIFAIKKLLVFLINKSKVFNLFLKIEKKYAVINLNLKARKAYYFDGKQE